MATDNGGRVLATWTNRGTGYRLVERDATAVHIDNGYVLERREYDAAGGECWVKVPLERRSEAERAMVAGIRELAGRPPLHRCGSFLTASGLRCNEPAGHTAYHWTTDASGAEVRW